MKILVVEDEKLLAYSLKTLLEGKGFTVETAYDGQTGSEYAELGVYDNGCVLSVASSGEEISKVDLKRIFRRFYRMDKARAMDHSYGPGLAIAESIVTQYRGKIWAESENGINTFYVQLHQCEKR